MKSTCLFIVLVLIAFLQPAQCAETNAARTAIEEQLREIDIKLAIEQYEKLSKMLLEGRHAMEWLAAEEPRNAQRDEKMLRMEKRDELLSKQLAEVKLRALHLGAQRRVERK